MMFIKVHKMFTSNQTLLQPPTPTVVQGQIHILQLRTLKLQKLKYLSERCHSC